jgi:hypothetical protein
LYCTQEQYSSLMNPPIEFILKGVWHKIFDF